MIQKIKKHAMALAALTIAIGSVTLMSFRAELKSSADQTFGMQVENRGQSNETRTWVPLDGLKEGEDYECTGITDICTGEFAPHQINPSNNLPYEDAEPSNSKQGYFELTTP